MKDTEKNSSIGERIRNLRVKMGYSQPRFAELFTPPISKATVSRWEKGNRTPEPDKLKQIAEICNVSVDYLINGSLEEQINKVKNHIKSVYSEYYDDFGKHQKREPPALSNDPLTYALETIDFIVNDKYTDYPKAWQIHRQNRNSQYSQDELNEIKKFYSDNFGIGITYCAGIVSALAKEKKIEPHQTILLFYLFKETAKSHFANHEKNNTGAINLVSDGITDLQNNLYSLIHDYDDDDNEIILPNTISPELYNKLDHLLDQWLEQVEKLRKDYN